MSFQMLRKKNNSVLFFLKQNDLRLVMGILISWYSNIDAHTSIDWASIIKYQYLNMINEKIADAKFF